MGKNDGEDSSQSEHGNWNVASDYAKLKIMKHLEDSDRYEIIALFGHYNLLDELMIDIDSDTLKIHGLRRLVISLIMLINNSLFAVKSKKRKKGEKKPIKTKDMSDRELLEFYKEELKKIKKIIPNLYRYKVNQINKTRLLKLDVEKYQKTLDYVIEVKSKINEPLNKYDLIFAYKEEFDSDKAKEQMKREMSSKG